MLKLLFSSLLLIQAARPTQQGAVISGVIRTSEGVPLGNVRVTAVAVENIAPLSTGDLRTTLTLTDSSGQYRLLDVPTGRYYIAAGLIASPTFYPGSLSIREAREIDVRAGEVIENISFRTDHPMGFRVRGRVLDESGKPAQKVFQSLALNSPEMSGKLQLPSEIPTTVTVLSDPLAQPHNSSVDSNGGFDIDGLAPGHYKVWVNGAAGMFPKDIDIGISDIAGLDLVVPAIIHLDGQIAFERMSPVPIMGVSFTSVQTSTDSMINGHSPSLMNARSGIAGAVSPGTFAYLAPARVDSEGKFQVSLPSGEYGVRLDGVEGLAIQSLAYGNFNGVPSILKIDSDGMIRITVSESAPRKN